MKANDSRFLTVQETAQYLRISRFKVYQWLSNGTLPFPHYKMERRVIFDRADIDRYMESIKKPALGSAYGI